MLCSSETDFVLYIYMWGACICVSLCMHTHMYSLIFLEEAVTVPHATHMRQFFIHFYVKTTMVLSIAQSSCPFQGENQGPLQLTFTTSLEVHRPAHWLYMIQTHKGGGGVTLCVQVWPEGKNHTLQIWSKQINLWKQMYT